MMNLPYKQKGVAAIMFVLIFPFFFGLFVLAIEGTRYLTSSARLGDVLESSSLAVAAAVDHSHDKARVQAYINATVKDADVSKDDITITANTCSNIYGDKCGQPGYYDKNGLQFNEYDVSVKSNFLSWFPGSQLIAGFNKNESLVNNAVARKYQQKYIDVAFVTDFSGSMLYSFNGQYQSKYIGVIDKITSIMGTLQTYNDLAKRSNKTERNNVGVVPYSQYNKTIKGNEITEVSYQYRRRSDNPIVPYDGDTISPSFAATELHDADRNLHQRYLNRWPSERDIQIYFGWDRGSHSLCRRSWSWDYDDSTYDDRDSDYWNYQFPEKRDLNNKILNYINSGYYFNIGLTHDFLSIKNKIDNFYPKGATSSSQGIMPAAQMLYDKKSTNKDNLIIVLSDGADNQGISKDYYDNGLCNKLRQRFKNKGQTLKIAVIGFGYDISKNPGLAECADSNNIFKAQSYDEIYSKILSLITEEIGHLYRHDYQVEKK